MFKEIPFYFVQQFYEHEVLDIEAACFAHRSLGKDLFRAELRVGGSIVAGLRTGGSDEHLLKLQAELRPLYASLPDGLLERRMRESGLDLQVLSANVGRIIRRKEIIRYAALVSQVKVQTAEEGRCSGIAEVSSVTRESLRRERPVALCWRSAALWTRFRSRPSRSRLLARGGGLL